MTNAQSKAVCEELARVKADLAALRQRHAEAVGAWEDVKTEYANGHGLDGMAAPRLDVLLASEAKARLT